MAVPVVRLLVLGVIRMRGKAHGYGVMRELLDWRVETWTSVKPGSIYHALKQLTKEDKLLDFGLADGSDAPGRVCYALTPEGEGEFQALLVAALSSFQLEELGAGVAFMQALPRQQVLALLKDQHRRAVENHHHLDGLVDQFPQRDEPPHTADLLTLWSGSLAATAAWTEDLIRRLEAGAYRMADDA
jgi:DNA-binding PadR family transcriptional regulator